MKPHRNNLAVARQATYYRHRNWTDPDLAFVCDKVLESGQSLTSIAKATGVTVGTLHRWLSGKTRRPQHITIVFVMRALGWESRWSQGGKP